MSDIEREFRDFLAKEELSLEEIEEDPEHKTIRAEEEMDLQTVLEVTKNYDITFPEEINPDTVTVKDLNRILSVNQNSDEINDRQKNAFLILNAIQANFAARHNFQHMVAESVANLLRTELPTPEFEKWVMVIGELTEAPGIICGPGSIEREIFIDDIKGALSEKESEDKNAEILTLTKMALMDRLGQEFGIHDNLESLTLNIVTHSIFELERSKDERLNDPHPMSAMFRAQAFERARGYISDANVNEVIEETIDCLKDMGYIAAQH